MSAACDLIRWIITYAVSGGFTHFVGVYLILVVLARTLGFVRVNVTRKTVTKKAKKADEKASA